MDRLDRIEMEMGRLNKKIPRLLSKLAAAGIDVKKVHYGDMDTDPDIEVSGGFDIQVCPGTVFMLSRELKDGRIYFYDAKMRLAEVIAVVKQNGHD